MLRLNNIYKSFPTGSSERLDVLRGVSMNVDQGSVAAIVGASGTGKSTLLHIIGALDRPSEGTVELDGRNLFTMTDEELASFRNRNLGFVFQFHHLLPEFTAVENTAMPAFIAGDRQDEALKRAKELLRDVGIAARADARPSELSGGEQQRVAVARALMNKPQIVLADEPSGNLDEENAAALHDLLLNLARSQNRTFVIVTHDPALARRADEIYRLHEGVLTPETSVHSARSSN